MGDESRSGNIGIYAKPNADGYQWILIKTLKCPPVYEPFDAPKLHQDVEQDNKVNMLITTIIGRDNEIKNVNFQLLTKFGLSMDSKSEWMSLIAAHPQLFDVTAYRRKLVLERLIVELKLWSTEWIHRILEEKVKNKPMLQWLVEDRKVARLHDHYRVYMSRFKVQHSALLNRRWLTFEENTKMQGQPGFNNRQENCFEQTQYTAGDIVIDPNIPAVPGAVRQITINNSNLFGDRPVVLQEFDLKHDDDYFSDDFADAICFDGKTVFLNFIPSDSYSFHIGQELRCRDSFYGKISRITSDGVCLKCVVNDVAFIRWIKKSDIPSECVLNFRYRDDLKNYKFVATKGQKDAAYISDQEIRTFTDLEKFSIDFKGEQVCMCAKPKEGHYRWEYLQSLNAPSDSNLGHIPTALLVDGVDNASSLNHFFSWLKLRIQPITDSKTMLSQFGLHRHQRAQWMRVIALHPQLFDMTAYRGRLCVERVIEELDLFSVDVVLRILREKHHDGRQMIQYLVEDRTVECLNDHYRVATSGFKISFISELLNRTWLRFQINRERIRYERVDLSAVEKTKYFIDDAAYALDTAVETINMMDVPRQLGYNRELFGDHKINIPFVVAKTAKLKNPPWHVSSQSPSDLSSWFQTTIKQKDSTPFELVVPNKSRNHHSSKNLLEKGTKQSYYQRSDDWIIFENVTKGAVPTMVVVLNNSDSNALKSMKIFGSDTALKSMKIFGSADGEVFEEWIHIVHILGTSAISQLIQLDQASVYYAWLRRFKYFRLCSMETYRSTYVKFYEFELRGVVLDTEQRASPSEFADVLSIDKHSKIVMSTEVTATDLMLKKIEFQLGNQWINVMVSRVTADKVCVKWTDGTFILFRWIQRNDIPMKLRLCVKSRWQICYHSFTAVIDKDGGTDLLSPTRAYTFDDDEDFGLPLSDLFASSRDPRTVSIYAKPRIEEGNFCLIKELQCNKTQFSKFAVKNVFHIDEKLTSKSRRFEVLAASNIIISKKGGVDVSSPGLNTDSKKVMVHEAALNYGGYVSGYNENGGAIVLISGGDVVNCGTLTCTASNEKKNVGGVIYINVDGVFENKGTINCGENGLVVITCSEFKNSGRIIPNPKVHYKNNTKENRTALKQLTAKNGSKRIKLRISDHKGRSPDALLEDGTGEHYNGETFFGRRGQSNGNYITFRTQSGTRIYPTSVAIRNYCGREGLKTVQIEGSTDGMQFEKWTSIGNIRNEHNHLQSFAVDPVAGYFAWERAYTYFKIKVMQNHDDYGTRFYEFRINGMDGKSD